MVKHMELYDYSFVAYSTTSPCFTVTRQWRNKSADNVDTELERLKWCNIIPFAGINKLSIYNYGG